MKKDGKRISMLHVIGLENSAERNAADTLAQVFATGWPWLESSVDSDVYILANVQCHGQNPRDLDLVVLANLPTQPHFQPRFELNHVADSGGAVPIARVGSLCVVVEVKDHDPKGVQFQGTNVSVVYNVASGQREWKSATIQSEFQKYSLKNYLEAHTGCSPWVANLIWLREVDGKDLPRGPHNILPTRFTLNGFLNWVAETTRMTPVGNDYLLTANRIRDDLLVDTATKFLTAKITPTSLDRRRMDRVVKSSLSADWLGAKSMLLLRGHGGTGKTMLLLQIAWHANREKGRKVLFLTFNHALLSDLRRLMTLLGVGDDIAQPRFQASTVHSFMRSILVELGVVKPEEDLLTGYESYKDTALRCMNEGAITQADIDKLGSTNSLAFDWDKILVDEGQDWPSNEMLILRRLFGTNKLVVADGLEQLVRQNKKCDWLQGLSESDYQVTLLKSGLRMKRNLAQFANALADVIGLADWHVQPHPDTHGGKVMIVLGDYFQLPGLHGRLLADASALGNEPVDLLACVPPSLVLREGEQRSLAIYPQLNALDQKIWNGTDMEVRSNTYPLSAKELRIVQYESCRGLEGWTCWLFGLDEFYDGKLAQWSPTSNSDDGIPVDSELQARQFAARWLMIPATRAMDTIVIQLNSANSFLTEKLRELARGKCRDFMEWVDSPEISAL
jgi:hypothetical protein